MTGSANDPTRPVHRNRRLRSLLAVAGCSLAGLIGAAPAAAVGLPTDEACEAEFTQPFAPWGDDALYKLVDGGDFETGAEGWQLSEGATLVPGTAQFGGETVLSLEPGATAVTPDICIDGTEDFSRMLSRSDGHISGVRVEVLTERGLRLPVGVVRGDSDWDASRRFLVPPFALTGDQTTFRYRFTALGFRGTEIDSVYVDPRRKH